MSQTLVNANGGYSYITYENNATDARQKKTNVSPTVLNRWGTGGNQTPYVQSIESARYDSRPTVRRLLPIETERLMGFPDNHTQIEWNGKSAEDCPDAPRYKACGNSMCVNVMEWIGRRIEEMERKTNGND